MPESFEVRLARLQEEFWASEKALQIQAKEYERRLETLNHAHERAEGLQHTFVPQDKFEDRLEAQATARNTAIEHLSDKLAEAHKAMDEQVNTLESSVQQIREHYLDREYYYREHKALEDRLGTLVQQSVRKEVYEAALGEWSTWRETVNKYMAAKEGQDDAKQTQATRNQWIIGTVVIILVVFINAVINGRI